MQFRIANQAITLFAVHLVNMLFGPKLHTIYYSTLLIYWAPGCIGIMFRCMHDQNAPSGGGFH
jgi:hypothetical protein